MSAHKLATFRSYAVALVVTSTLAMSARAVERSFEDWFTTPVIDALGVNAGTLDVRSHSHLFVLVFAPVNQCHPVASLRGFDRFGDAFSDTPGYSADIIYRVDTGEFWRDKNARLSIQSLPNAPPVLSFDSPVPVEMIQSISRGTTLRVKVKFPGYEPIYDAFSLKGATAAMRAAYNACIKLGDGDPNIKKYFPAEPRTPPAQDDSKWF